MHDRDTNNIYTLYEGVSNDVSLSNQSKKWIQSWTGDLLKDIEIYYKHHKHMESTRPLVEWAAAHNFYIDPLNWVKMLHQVPAGLDLFIMTKNYDKANGGIWRMSPEQAQSAYEARSMGWQYYPDNILRFRLSLDSDSLPVPGTEDDIAVTNRLVPAASTELEEWSVFRSRSGPKPTGSTLRGTNPFTHGVVEHFTKMYETQDPEWEKMLEVLEHMEKTYQRETRGKKRTRQLDL